MNYKSLWHWLVFVPLAIALYAGAIWLNYTVQKYTIKQAILETKK